MHMDDQPLITRVILENYKSIAFCDVKLGPLGILAGPNGAGKSNFLDALKFLSEVMYAPIANAIQKRGGFSRIYCRSATGDARLGFRVDFCAGNRKGYFSFRVRPDAQAGYIFEREKCVIEPSLNWKWTGYNSPKPSSTLHMLKDPEFSILVELLSSFRFYNFNSDSLRQPSPSYDEPLLNDSGSNLPNVLHHMTTYRRAASDRVRQYLHAINPAIDFVDAQEVNTYRALAFKLGTSQADFAASQMSDGTLRSLAVLVALFQRTPGAAVDLVGLEEPEAALHPAAAGVLFGALDEASASVQVIATTHSADLLDNKDLDTDAILAVELEDGTTRIAHVDQTGRQALRERLYTAGELMRMNYLRPEPTPPPDSSEVEAKLFGDPVPA
jgi:predicted ATPase